MHKCRGYDGKLKIGILPVTTFASGHTYFVQRLHEKYNLDPYVAHATFQYSGTPGKRHRFRENLMWVDPEAYFQHVNGFVSVLSDVTKELQLAKEMNLTGLLEDTVPHFNLVNVQLRTIRALFGISTALERIAILPPLWCGLDRWWYENACTLFILIWDRSRTNRYCMNPKNSQLPLNHPLHIVLRTFPMQGPSQRHHPRLRASTAVSVSCRSCARY